MANATVCAVGSLLILIMKNSLHTGIAFGLTSAVITILGLMVGLHSGTHSKNFVLGGNLTIAIADAFSDALGIHASEESKNTQKLMSKGFKLIADSSPKPCRPGRTV